MLPSTARPAHETLRASERRYRAMLEALDLVVVLLDAKGRVRFCNPFALKLLGCVEGGLVGARWFDRFAVAEHRGEVERRFLANIEADSIPREEEYEILAAGRERRSISWNNVELRDPRNALVGVVSIGMDNTERRQLEGQLRMAQKMEAIGSLAGGVAHDFNNLTTVVLGYCELLLDRLEPGLARDQVEQIRMAGERCASLTGELLAFGRKQVLLPRVLDLSRVVAGMTKVLRSLVGESIDVAVGGSGDARVKADPGQVEQVILNLAINARDAMPAGGQLTIEIGEIDLGEDGPDLPKLMPPGPYVLLTVSDTGYGMDAETRSRIFEPFFTTKERGKGTGLGLSTVYGIVKQSGGYIWVESESGRGTTFSIYLPRVDEAIDADAPVSTGHRVPGGSETILLVEDDEQVRKLTAEVLRDDGYRVIEARGGIEALNVYQGVLSRPIDLLLTDLVMPQMAGRELAARLILARPDLPVLYMSGHSEGKGTAGDVIEPGTPFLHKPFTGEVLRRKVRQVLDARRAEG